MAQQKGGDHVVPRKAWRCVERPQPSVRLLVRCIKLGHAINTNVMRLGIVWYTVKQEPLNVVGLAEGMIRRCPSSTSLRSRCGCDRKTRN